MVSRWMSLSHITLREGQPARFPEICATASSAIVCTQYNETVNSKAVEVCCGFFNSVL